MASARQGDEREHFRTCNLCEAMCGVAIKTSGSEIVSIRGDKDDPFSKGYICPKAMALKDIHEDPDRLRYPMRKTARGFERMGWDEAFDEVTQRLRDVQKKHGKNAIGIYLGNPSVHNHATLLYGLPFAKSLGTRSRFSATSVDQLPHHLAAYLMFGHQLLLPVPDIDRTDFLLIIGANPAVSNGSLMTAPGAQKRIEAIRARGGRVVVVDPRRTETAAIADEHIFIRPGTDVALVLGMLRTIIEERLAAPGRLADFIDGLGAIEREVLSFSIAGAAAATGIDEATIRKLARDFARARSASAYGRMGASTQEFGGVTQWLLNVLNIVTGNLDKPGGPMFTKPAIDIVGVTGKLGSRGHFDRGRSRVRGLPEHGGEYPAVAMAEEILTEGPGQIRGMVTVAGNPVLSTPNGRKLDEAFASLDFMVSIDIYLNETTRHAHIILPPTTALEHDHYDLVFHVLAVRNTAKYSPALFEPAEGTRHEWEIYSELTSRLEARGKAGPYMARARRAIARALTPARILDLGLRAGPYGLPMLPLGGGLSIARLLRDPHGVDLGALEPCLPGRLFTRDKRIPLAPDIFVRDLDRVRRTLFAPPAPIAAAEREASESAFDLRLIGRRQLRTNNSWSHNSYRLVKGRERCTVIVHPDDAAARGLAPGQRARVSSRVGAIELPVEVSDEIMRGVVSIPHGWGHDRPGIALRTAAQHPGASINDLTDELRVDALAGTAALSGVPVRLEPASEAAPA